MTQVDARAVRHLNQFQTVKAVAGSSDTVDVLDMHKPDVAAKAKQYGVKCVRIATPIVNIRAMII